MGISTHPWWNRWIRFPILLKHLALDDHVRLWRSQCLQSRFGCCAMLLEGWSVAAPSCLTLRRTSADRQCFCNINRCVNTSPAPVSLWNLTPLLLLTPTRTATTTKHKLHRLDAENSLLCVYACVFSAAIIHLFSSDLHFYDSAHDFTTFRKGTDHIYCIGLQFQVSLWQHSSS